MNMISRLKSSLPGLQFNEPANLEGWRIWFEQLMAILGVILLPISLLISFPVLMDTKNFIIIAFYGGLWIIFLARLFMEPKSYKLNAFIIFLLLYVMIIFFYITMGPVYTRPALFVLIAVLSAMMFGKRGAIVSTILNIIILLLLYRLVGPENKKWAIVYADSYYIWIKFIVNISVISLVAGLSISFLLKKLDRSLSYERDARLKLSTQTENLTSAKMALENEMKQRDYAEEALRKSEEKYRLLIYNIPSVTWISDEQGKTTFISPNVRTLLGFTPEEIYASGSEIWFGRIHPDNVNTVKSSFQLMFTQSREFDIEYRIKKKDGTWIWIHDKAVLAFEKDGIQYAYGIFSDVTERKASEEAIRDSEERLKLLFDNAPDGYYLADLEGRFLKGNKKIEQITGYTNEEVLGKIFLEANFLPSDQVPKAKALLEKSRHGSPCGPEELVLTRKDGKAVTLEINSYPIKIKNQVQILGIARDISERKRAEKEKKKLEDQLIRVQKMEAIGTLAGGIAHDFNNILTAMVGYTGIALIDAGKGTSLESNLHEVLKAGNRAKDLVKQILTFSRSTEQEMKPIQVKIIIKEVLKLIKASLPSTIEIRQSVFSDSQIMADPVQIHQVLMNLCTNAGHAMREHGGILEVGLSDVELDTDFLKEYPEMNPGSYIKMTVRDTGQGMAPEIIDRIFDPYFTTKAPGEGTGLGLAIVQGIVESYKGAVTVMSEPGKGSTFTIFLPVIENRQGPDEKSDEPLPRGKERILFIDDEPAIASLGMLMLERLGYEVIVQKSGSEALALFKTQHQKIDLVITDMTMPGMTGEALAREMMHVRPDIPIILCTGFSHRINQQKALQSGIKKFIMKPFTVREVAAAIREALDATS